MSRQPYAGHSPSHLLKMRIQQQFGELLGNPRALLDELISQGVGITECEKSVLEAKVRTEGYVNANRCLLDMLERKNNWERQLVKALRHKSVGGDYLAGVIINQKDYLDKHPDQSSESEASASGCIGKVRSNQGACVDKPNQGVEEPNLGVDEPIQGVDEPNQGVDEPDGLPRPIPSDSEHIYEIITDGDYGYLHAIDYSKFDNSFKTGSTSQQCPPFPYANTTTSTKPTKRPTISDSNSKKESTPVRVSGQIEAHENKTRNPRNGHIGKGGAQRERLVKSQSEAASPRRTTLHNSSGATDSPGYLEPVRYQNQVATGLLAGGGTEHPAYVDARSLGSTERVNPLLLDSKYQNSVTLVEKLKSTDKGYVDEVPMGPPRNSSPGTGVAFFYPELSLLKDPQTEQGNWTLREQPETQKIKQQETQKIKQETQKIKQPETQKVKQETHKIKQSEAQKIKQSETQKIKKETQKIKQPIPPNQIVKRDSVEEKFTKSEVCSELTSEPGYVPNISEEEVESKLNDRVDGCYIVWYYDELSHPAITVNFGGKLKTFLIRKTTSCAGEHYYIDPEQKTAYSLKELVKYHRNSGIRYNMNRVINLVTPV